MLTLKAAGLLDVDAGEIVRPGILRIDGDRIVGVGGEPEGDIIDLGDQILLPGLMDMEVNLLMGGRGETPGLSQVQDDPPTRVLRAVGNARRTLRAGFTTVRNLGLFVKTGGYLLDVALGKAIDAGLDRRAAHCPGRPRDHAHRRAPGPDDVRRVRTAHAGADGRGGHRQRSRRDPQGGAIPDQARRAADQGVRFRRRDVVDW